MTVPLFNAAGILQVAPGGDAGLADRPARRCRRASRTLAPLDGQAVPPDFAARFKTAVRPRAGDARRATGYRAMAASLRGDRDAPGAAGNDRTRVIDRRTSVLEGSVSA